MIKGVGIDIVEISRIKEKIKIADKILTKNEYLVFESLNDLQKVEFLAGRFAAKEAYYKAKNDKTLGYLDFEVLNDESGKPYTNLDNVSVSISHEQHYCVAIVIIE